MAGAPLRIDFRALEWTKVEGGGAHGRMKRHTLETGGTIRILEISPKWNETDWCQKPHTGFVIAGSLRLDFEEGSPIIVGKGQAFFIPTGSAHKATCKRTTRIFMVD